MAKELVECSVCKGLGIDPNDCGYLCYGCGGKKKRELIRVVQISDWDGTKETALKLGLYTRQCSDGFVDICYWNGESLSSLDPKSSVKIVTLVKDKQGNNIAPSQPLVLNRGYFEFQLT